MAGLHSGFSRLLGFLRDWCGTGRAAGLLRALYIEPRAHRISVFSITFSRLLLNQVAR